MLKSGTVIGDIVETFKEEGGKAAKEIARVPADLVKASFEQPIPDPSPDRKEQLELKKKADLIKVRSGLAMLQESPPQQQEDKRPQQGVEKAERGLANTMGQMNNATGPQPLSANMTPKKKPQPLVLRNKRKDMLHGQG